MTEMTTLTVQLIIEFSKRLPGFDTLLREDQIILLKVLAILLTQYYIPNRLHLKSCSGEVLTLRYSRKYDMETDSIVYANNLSHTRDNYKSAGVGHSADALFNFCRSICTLKLDNAEYSLLTAIVIFSGQ